ncbi:MAG: NUDIX domain-containing protein [Armatimonadetes bacterium]|nr:NUDIX domain-containing protein [Armatimonadota bacterium]
MATRKFPVGKHGRQQLVFYPAPYRAPLRAFASLVFCWLDDQVLLCNIEDRGWCIPSGRVEPFEEPIEAARREAVEEAGAKLRDLQYLGCYRVSERREVRWADVFVAEVEALGEITCPQESLGRQLICPTKVHAIYYNWSPLVEEVLGYSREVIERMRAQSA